MVLGIVDPPLQLGAQLEHLFHTAFVRRSLRYLHFELADIACVGVVAQERCGSAFDEVGGKGILGVRIRDAVWCAPAAGGEVHADRPRVVWSKCFAAEWASGCVARWGFLDDVLATRRAENMT